MSENLAVGFQPAALHAQITTPPAPTHKKSSPCIPHEEDRQFIRSRHPYRSRCNRSIVIQPRPLASTRRIERKLGLHATRVARSRWGPADFALGQFFVADVELQQQLVGIDRDAVAFLDEGDVAARRRLPDRVKLIKGLGGDVARCPTV